MRPEKAGPPNAAAVDVTNRHFRDFAEIAADWFWETDAGGRLTFVSDRFAEIAEIPVKRIIGQKLDSLAGIDLSADPAKLHDAMATRHTFRCLVQRVIFSDGRQHFWQLSGKPIFALQSGAFAGYRGSGNDVTQSIESLITLTEAIGELATVNGQQAHHDRARLLDAINAIPAGFVLWDATDRLVLCNTRYREIYPLTADLIVPGVSYEKLVREGAARRGVSLADPDTVRWVTQHLAMRQLARHSAPGAALHDQALQDGRWIQVDEQATSDGSLVAIHTDVTERRKREASDHEREKLAALGHLAGGVAHEINNLLQPAIIFPDFIAERLPASDLASREDLATILDGARKTRDIVKNILRFARKEELALEPLDLVAEIRAALAFVRDVIPRSVKIKEMLDPAPATQLVAANKTQLVQIITNLVVNAAHAMRNRGTLTVAAATSQPTEAEATQLGIETGTSYLAISVSDTGCGIDAATQARIFEPFFTTKPVGEGTGLGLSVVYGILKSWKGAIAVASEVGRGTTFTLYIPQLRPAAASLALAGS
jgi:PAS domain S-box-containing protein